MYVSRPSVHPVEAPPQTAQNVPRARMKDIQGMPGTCGGFALRLFQFIFAVISLLVMASTSDFASASAFWSEKLQRNFLWVVWVMSLNTIWWCGIQFALLLPMEFGCKEVRIL
ncbi:hypothetical protein ACB098_09G026900 [Castanea mollissima]